MNYLFQSRGRNRVLRQMFFTGKKSTPVAPGSTTGLLGLLNLRHLHLWRCVLAAEPIPGQEQWRASSSCCCSSSHHFAFSLPGSLPPSPPARAPAALCSDARVLLVSVPAAQELT